MRICIKVLVVDASETWLSGKNVRLSYWLNGGPLFRKGEKKEEKIV